MVWNNFIQNWIGIPWVRFILVVFIVIVLTKLFSMIATNILRKAAALTETKKDDEVVDKIENPIVYIITLWVIDMGLKQLNFWQENIDTIEKAIYTLMLFILARIIINIGDLLLIIWSEKSTKLTSNKLDDQLINVINKSMSIIIYIVAAVYAMKIWNIDIWPILGSLGIAGIGVAFALQEALKNLLGGIQLILDKNFKVGDIIELSTGESGLIHEITLRSTRVKTWDNRLVIIPNATMANDIITNVSKPDKTRRISVKFGVEYGSEPNYVKKIVMQEIKKLKNIEKKNPEPMILFKEMGDSALLFEALYWITDMDYFLSAKDEGTKKIYDRLNKEGIGIPFPQQTVWFNDESKKKKNA
ncbi:MAG: mechanosensitive ion channel family protein [Nanobdellota archaeon]